jgi:CHAT domain-containing protein
MLLQAQRVASPVSRSTLTLALVAETHSHNRTPEVIHGVEEELQHVAYVANLNSIKVLHHQASATTVASTVSAMRNANMVHFACDGVQDISDVTESGFYLGDGLLTISKLMELKLGGTFLAFLSTFETTQRDKERPDQGMHMAAAMLFMGFKNVVTTMWYVDTFESISQC